MKKILFSVLFVFLVSSCSETKESLENTLDTTAKNVSVKVETMSDAFQDAKDRTASGIKQAQDTVNAVWSGMDSAKKTLESVESSVNSAVNTSAQVIASGANAVQNAVK